MRHGRLSVIVCAGLWLGACDGAQGDDKAPAHVRPGPAAAATGSDVAEGTPSPRPSVTCFDDGEHEICVDPSMRKGVWGGPVGQLQFVPGAGTVVSGRAGLPIVKMVAGHPLQAKAQLSTAPTGALRATCKTTTRQYRRNKNHPNLPPPGPSSQVPFDVCALIGVRSGSSARKPAAPGIQ